MFCLLNTAHYDLEDSYVLVLLFLIDNVYFIEYLDVCQKKKQLPFVKCLTDVILPLR